MFTCFCHLTAKSTAGYIQITGRLQALSLFLYYCCLFFISACFQYLLFIFTLRNQDIHLIHLTSFYSLLICGFTWITFLQTFIFTVNLYPVNYMTLSHFKFILIPSQDLLKTCLDKQYFSFGPFGFLPPPSAPELIYSTWGGLSTATDEESFSFIWGEP